MRINRRLFIYFTLIAALSILAGGFLDYFNHKSDFKKRAADFLGLLNEIKSDSILNLRARLAGRAVDFASDGFIRDSVAALIKNPKNKKVSDALREHLIKNKMSLDPEITGINIIGLDDKIVFSTKPEEEGNKEIEELQSIIQSVKGYDYGTAAVNDSFCKTRFLEKCLGLAALAPLTDKESGEKIGVLINHIKIDDLIDIIRRGVAADAEAPWSIEKSGIFSIANYLLKRDGTVLSSSYSAATSTCVMPIVKTVKQDFILKSCDADWFNHSFRQYKNYQEKEVIGTSRCLNGWILVSELGLDYLYAPLKIQKLIFFVIGIAILMLILPISYLVSRALARPIRLLTEAARRVRAGNLLFRVDIKSRDEIGELSSALSNMADKLLMEQKLLAKKVAERTADLQKFKLAVDSASDQITITDPEGIVLYANQAAEKITGYPIRDILGKKAGALWGGLMPKEYYVKMWDTIKNKKLDFDGEVTNRRKNGEKYEASIDVAPILDNRGRVIFFVGLERDISKEKEVDRVKTEFVSLASHQLRTPLTSIKWSSELLLDSQKNLDANQRMRLKEIYMSNERMIRLVNALLNVSRIEMGTLAISFKTLDAKKIIDSEISLSGQLLKEKKLTLGKIYDKELPKIHSDEKLLRIVFANLLSNAIKYTARGGRISVNVRKQPKGILISVADTGYGIPRRQQHLVFTKLFRGDNIKLKSMEGTGLGLYMAKKIIELLRGKLWFTSEENKGSAFYFTLPLSGPKAKKAGLELIKDKNI